MHNTSTSATKKEWAAYATHSLTFYQFCYLWLIYDPRDLRGSI